MIAAARLLILGSLVLAGCHTAQRVAVTTFRVVDAPARYIRDRIDPPAPAPTPEVSDVATPGHQVQSPTARPTSPRRVAGPSRTSTETPAHSRTESTTTVNRRPTASPTPRPAGTQTTQFPTAKPVPGKPGYVYSIDPKGGIVDVTGYKSGDRAKDPYTQQIFIVP